MDLVLRAEPLEGPSASDLLRAFADEIARRYPGWNPGIGPSARPEEFVHPRGRFVVAYTDGEPAGCGGVKRLDEHTGEVKRLYVAPGARGQGIARRLLGALEEAARELGFRTVRLDTGDRQPEALALFRSAGYQEISDYNANSYASYWFEKSLTDRGELVGKKDEALAWQVGVWDRISDVYPREIDRRFRDVVAHCIGRAGLRQGDDVLDLGTGTGAVALQAARLVGPEGRVKALDISPNMLAIVRTMVAGAGLGNVDVVEGGADAIPAEDGEFDAVVASLSLMFVVDRDATARECARVLRPGGRLVAAVWAGPDDADIVRFQQIAGTFAPAPPVPGVGPGAMADPSAFLGRLADAGIDATVETETIEFAFDDFDHAWDVLAGVTTASLDPDQQAAAQQAVRDAMWPDPASPRVFRNLTQFIVGTREA